MTMLRRLDLLLWGIALSGAVTAATGWRASVPPVVAAPVPSMGRAPVVAPVSPETLRAATDRVAESDLFRLDRRPAAVAYRPESDGKPQTVAPHPPRPQLSLQGIIGVGGSVARGPRWAALLGGVPGRDGSVLVHGGDTIGGLMVRRVGRDTVVVSASDTTWRLTVRQAWQ